MRILNFGSLNLDFVYSVPHIVAPGETISSTGLELYCGGKGLNQSIALARAGAYIYHAGLIGSDGQILLETLVKDGVDVGNVKVVDTRSGNAIIQVDAKGQNSIVLYGGANQCNQESFVDDVLSRFDEGDWLLVQNEVNLLPYMIDKAYDKGLRIAINPSPFDEKILQCDLTKISLFLLNEIEGNQITGESVAKEILRALREKHPRSSIVLTLGKQGAVYWSAAASRPISHGIYDVSVEDTTAAGDTFTGYFIAAITGGKTDEEALRLASVASSISVSRKGASTSIPVMNEVVLAKLELSDDANH